MLKSTKGGTVPYPTPEALIEDLVAARDRGDISAALACYEPSAAVVLESGHVVSGPEAVRATLEAFAALRAQFSVDARRILDADGVALHLSRWTLRAHDAEQGPFGVRGASSDVARRQPDGSWLLAVDNPWGVELLERRTT